MAGALAQQIETRHNRMGRRQLGHKASVREEEEVEGARLVGHRAWA